VIFAGDTLFTLGCGRVMEGEPATLWRSLERFLPLPDATQVYSGHDYVLSNARFALAAEPGSAALAARAADAESANAEGRFLIPSTMGQERATNPFLRAGEPKLAQVVNLASGTQPSVVFAALRAWKNKF
jgi:hydroxyacylglutathione hydrolase